MQGKYATLITPYKGYRNEACKNYPCTFENREDEEDVHFFETSKIS